MSQMLVDAIADMREQEALSAVQELLSSGTDPMTILALCREAMTVVGERFESGEYFLPELILAGEMLSQIADIVKPRIQSGTTTESSKPVKVLLGTVQGDLHDIGKNIVGFMLDVNGIQVHDLGIDVPVERFVEAIEQEKPDVVGLSGFLTVAFEAMKETIEAIENAGLRNQVKIMIGGGMVDEHIRAYAGADAYGRDAMAAVSLVETVDWKGLRDMDITPEQLFQERMQRVEDAIQLQSTGPGALLFVLGLPALPVRGNALAGSSL